MDERGTVEYLTSRVEQLQRERDELKKDIEQLCLQQAGPSYLAVATRMHFQRTASLEQEIESLNKKLAGCTREKQNLQEELSEAYRIKSQLADLHGAEVLKNMEAEKQLKFFQSCVAAAFSERDQTLMESEKAKEKEEIASERLTIVENRVEELQLAYHEEKKLNTDLQIQLKELKEQSEASEKVINKFYDIFQRDSGFYGDDTCHAKCSQLLGQSSDNWIFKSDNETSTSKYIASLEEELEKQKSSIDNLQSNLRMGLQIERHMKKNIQSLERKQIMLANTIKSGLSALHDFHSKQRSEVMEILEKETSHMKSIFIDIQEKMDKIQINSKLKLEALERETPSLDAECRDVHITSDVNSDVLEEKTLSATTSAVMESKYDASDTLAQVLQEKITALLLLSQQEERYLLERDVNEALQKKLEQLQINLSQVTNEKVQALMELAQLKLEYQLLQESRSHASTPRKSIGDNSEKFINVQQQEGKLKNILKKSYLRRFMRKGLNEEIVFHESSDEVSARLKVENAALQESIANLEHLTSSLHRLRITLLKARDDAISGSPMVIIMEALKSIITEANNIKTALGISVPVSWSADAAIDSATYENLYESTDRVDPVSSTGLEMVELLILATQLLQENLMNRVVD